MSVPSSVLDRVRALRPSWAALTDSDLSEASALAELLVSADYYGDAWADAMVYAIAHAYLLQSEQASGGSTPGAYSSVSTGQRSVSFSTYPGANNDPWWALTGYGRTLMQIRDTRVTAYPFVVL